MKLFPHKLVLMRAHSARYTDAGEPIADSKDVLQRITLRCNIEPSSHARVVYQDGKAVNYSFHVYLDHDCPELKAGDKVYLYYGDGTELRSGKAFTVLQFFRYQLSAQIWV